MTNLVPIQRSDLVQALIAKAMAPPPQYGAPTAGSAFAQAVTRGFDMYRATRALKQQDEMAKEGADLGQQAIDALTPQTTAKTTYEGGAGAGPDYMAQNSDAPPGPMLPPGASVTTTQEQPDVNRALALALQGAQKGDKTSAALAQVLLQQRLAQVSPHQQPYTLGPGMQRRDANNQVVAENTLPDPDTVRETAQVQNYKFAVENGYHGSFTDFLKMGSAQPFNQETVEPVAQMIANGQMPMLSGFSLRSPWGQAVLARVGDINPAYQGNSYQNFKAFTTGRQGDTVRSLNVATSHLDLLDKLGTALGNNDQQFVNRVRQAWKQQFGSEAPVDFNVAKQVVSSEIIKAVTNAGGALADREELQSQFDKAQSPEQIKGAVQTAKALLAGQLQGLRIQYKAATQRDDFDSMLSPETVKQISTLVPADQTARPKPPAGDGWSIEPVQ